LDQSREVIDGCVDKWPSPLGSPKRNETKREIKQKPGLGNSNPVGFRPFLTCLAEKTKEKLFGLPTMLSKALLALASLALAANAADVFLVQYQNLLLCPPTFFCQL
jgi:hypothetical protein